mmetsp:Transcript_8662/g.13068  ORF Transcript_8662/g.13068 Transcript_8662/m.13068 type:complete len:355 (+) Transcript_8662:71-1135(+)
MCVSTMANDGGLRKVFQSADLVYNQLLILDQHKLHDNSNIAAGDKRKPSRSLSEVSSSSIIKSPKINLSQHSSASLRRAVTPLIQSMEQLDAAALLSLNPNQDGNGAVLDPKKGSSVPPIHDRIVPYHRFHRAENTVRYLHAREVADKYTVGIFIFPPGASIPLHDHPSMVVISRVLYGELKVKSYSVVSSVHDDDVVEEMKEETSGTKCDSSPSRIRSSINRIKDFVSRAVLSSHHDHHAATQHKLQVQVNKSPLGVQFSSDGDGESSAIISAPNVTALYPDEGNCHSFVAGPYGAAVLDVLLPPYAEDEHRDCTFYEAVENEHGYCLTPIDQPGDFDCLSGEYGRFDSCDQY